MKAAMAADIGTRWDQQQLIFIDLYNISYTTSRLSRHENHNGNERFMPAFEGSTWLSSP